MISLVEGSQIDLRPSRVLRSVLFRDEHIADREHAATNPKLPLRERPFVKREHIEVVPRYTSDAVSLLEESAEAAGAARGDFAVYVRIAALQAPGIGNLPCDFELETLGLNFANVAEAQIGGQCRLTVCIEGIHHERFALLSDAKKSGRDQQPLVAQSQLDTRFIGLRCFRIDLPIIDIQQTARWQVPFGV